MADNRTFPDVDFVNKSVAEIVSEMVTTWETQMGRTMGKADPVRLMIGWEAMINAQLYTAINESAKLNVPRNAYGTYLDSLAELFYHGLSRLGAASATTTLRFTISQISEQDTVIPVGTRVTQDGTVYFATTDTTYIPAGALYADVPAECTVAGTIGNGYIPGALNVLVDNDAVVNCQSVVNITTSEGGSAEESDEAFYERMRESMGAYSTAGPTDSYIYHAMSANPLVCGVRATSPEPGIVEVYVMLQDGQVPGEEVLAQIQQYLSESTIRPLTDYVTVKAPTAREFCVEVLWYTQVNSGISREVLEERVMAAIETYVTWQTAEIGRDINPSYLTRLLMETGIKRVEVLQPVFTPIAETEVAVLSSADYTFGGEEDA